MRSVGRVALPSGLINHLRGVHGALSPFLTREGEVAGDWPGGVVLGCVWDQQLDQGVVEGVVWPGYLFWV